MAKNRERLDRVLVQRGLAESRAVAQALIMEARVIVEGRTISKAGTGVLQDADIEVLGPSRPFSSRGGQKLEAALDVFDISVENLTALDVGAGTGGFTDCMLKRGAAHVFALDVGHGQLDQKLREDSRVTVLEKKNARFLSPDDLPSEADLAVMDVSFISANLILPRLPAVLRGTTVIVLVKPQFEVGRGEVGRGGVVRDRAGFIKALRSVMGGGERCGMRAMGITPSPIKGSAGNQEFLLHMTLGGSDIEGLIPEPELLIATAMAQLPESQ
jgi:23S rRNA (cytidine1920-2'-O)/16S rRNA (cytidine1409-2'-O)-methyltransferase